MSLEEATVKNRRLKNEISKAASQVRKKYKAIKLGQLDEVQTLSKMFKPVTEKITDLSETMRTTIKTEAPVTPPKVKIIPVHATSSTPPKTLIKGDVRPPQWSPRKNVAVPEFIPEETIIEHIPPIDIDENVSNSSIADFRRTYAQISRERPEALEEYLNQYPEITRHYLEQYFTDSANKFDTTYGVTYDSEKNNWQLGKDRIDFDSRGNILIKNQTFTGNSGLYELLFKTKPDESLISEQDRLNYRKILNLTNVHRREFDPDKQIRGTNSYKYKTYIQESPKRRRSKSTKGFGMSDNDVLVFNRKPIEYVFWDNANELVERLRLLIASTVAGNNNHNNEIVSIVEELREAGIIA